MRNKENGWGRNKTPLYYQDGVAPRLSKRIGGCGCIKKAETEPIAGTKMRDVVSSEGRSRSHPLKYANYLLIIELLEKK